MRVVYLCALKERFAIAAAAMTAALGLVAPADAALSISLAPTQNVACINGHCETTATQAILNVGELRRLLARYRDVRIKAGVARTISIDAALTWTSTSALRLAAHGLITVNKPVTVAGHAAVNIQSDGLVFARKASLTFWDVTSALTINGNVYTLVPPDLQSISLTLNEMTPGFYALARDWDWNASSIHCCWIDEFPGVFDGLGHTASNLDLGGSRGGMFRELLGTIRNFNLENASFTYTDGGSNGLLVSRNDGTIDHVSVSGTLRLSFFTGGLVGENYGIISNSRAHVHLENSSGWTGGLVAYNQGTISASYATGEIRAHNPYSGQLYGGLVAYNADPRYYPFRVGKIENSYSRVRLRGMNGSSLYGGLAAQTGPQSSIVNSYAAGKIEGRNPAKAHPGGVTGSVMQEPASFSHVYWDLDLGVHDPHAGAGNFPDQRGMLGLTDTQLKSGLPTGFNPKIWAQDSAINEGYPYLRSNPPTH